jgi:hypothetical protein
MNIKRAEITNTVNSALQMVLESDTLVDFFEYEGFTLKTYPDKPVELNDKGIYKHNLFSSVYACKYQPVAYPRPVRTTLGVAIKRITGLNVRLLSEDFQIMIEVGEDNWETLKNVIDSTPDYAFVQHTEHELLVGSSQDITSFLPIYELTDEEVQKIETFITTRPINNYSVTAKVTGNNVNGDINLADYQGVQDTRYALITANNQTYVRDSLSQTEMVYGHENISLRLGEEGITSVSDAKTFIYNKAVEYLKTISPVRYELDAQTPFLVPGTMIKYRDIQQVLNKITYEIRNI